MIDLLLEIKKSVKEANTKANQPAPAQTGSSRFSASLWGYFSP